MIKRKRKPLPEHYKSWEKLLKWVDKDVSFMATELESHIKASLSDVVTRPRGRYLCFYRRKPNNKSIFAALLLTREYLKVRIRTEPEIKFKDPKNLVKEKKYKRWFFSSGEEREFVLNKPTDRLDLAYAVELIKQSYNLSK